MPPSSPAALQSLAVRGDFGCRQSPQSVHSVVSCPSPNLVLVVVVVMLVVVVVVVVGGAPVLVVVVVVEVVIVVVVAVVVVVVVGQLPSSPGLQSGMSATVGHGFPPSQGPLVMASDLVPCAPPDSHAAVQSLKVYAQSFISVVVVIVVVMVVIVVVEIVVVVVVVGQLPSPGLQSGMSVTVGHGAPPFWGSLVMASNLVPGAPPDSHAAVQSLKVYAQSSKSVVVVVAVVVVKSNCALTPSITV